MMIKDCGLKMSLMLILICQTTSHMLMGVDFMMTVIGIFLQTITEMIIEPIKYT